LTTSPQILIVDASSESREVLSALLARHGISTIEARRPEQAIELTDRHQPDLILFDADSERCPQGNAASRLYDAADCSDTPMVILGTVPRPEQQYPPGQFVSKPYHYGPLIRRIEALLATG